MGQISGLRFSDSQPGRIEAKEVKAAQLADDPLFWLLVYGNFDIFDHFSRISQPNSSHFSAISQLFCMVRRAPCNVVYPPRDQECKSFPRV